MIEKLEGGKKQKGRTKLRGKGSKRYIQEIINEMIQLKQDIPERNTGK